MSIADWGSVTWTLFHTLAEKLKENNQEHIPLLFGQINNICKNLPCPTCREHAIHSLNTCNKNKINSRENLIRFLWEFHNIVNKRKDIKPMPFEECKELYKKYRTGIVVQNFLNIFSLNARNEKGMMDTFHRARCISQFKTYIVKYHSKFNS